MAKKQPTAAERIALAADPNDSEDFDVTEAELEAALTARRARGRPALGEAGKQKVNIRISPDVLATLRASGRGWQTRVDDILRRAVMKG
jgi:uncharacterized protein (DUF4415 family)